MGSVNSANIISYIKADDQASLTKYYSQDPPPVSINAVLDNHTKYRAINLAIEQKNVGLVRFLIYTGANYVLTDAYGNTPLMQCMADKQILDVFLSDKDTPRNHTLLAALRHVKPNATRRLVFGSDPKPTYTSLVSELIDKQLWSTLGEVLRILKRLDSQEFAKLLCLPNSDGNIPLYDIIKNAPENNLDGVLDLLSGIKNDSLNFVISNDACLISVCGRSNESIIRRVKFLHHQASTSYTEIIKMCNSDPNLYKKLLDAGLDNNTIKTYEKNITLFAKADALEYVHILITEKLTDEHYSELFSEPVKKKFADTYKIPLGTILNLTNIHVKDTIMKANKENMAQSQPTYFKDIIGQNHAIQFMINETIPFIKRARKFGTKLTGANFPARLRRFLFYGPGGTGKSLISRSLAYELNAPFIRMKIAGTQSKYYGDTEMNLKAFMELGVELAHTIDPISGKEPGICVVIIEEFDAIGAKVVDDCSSSDFNRKINAAVKQLLEVDLYPELIICASVNKIGSLDAAIKTRLSTFMLIALPDAKTRCELLLHYFSKAKVEINPSVDLKKWANDTELYGGREIADIAHEIINKAKRIHQKWLYDQNDGLYFPMANVNLQPDFEGSADDLEFDGKQYKNLWVSELETSKTRSLSEEDFLAYMKDAVEHDPCAKQIFCRIREKLEKPENVPNSSTSQILPESTAGSNFSSASTSDTASDTNSDSPAASTPLPQNIFENFSSEIWKMFLEFLNGGEKKEDYKHLTKSMFEMIQKHVNSYKLKVSSEGTLLDKWEILIYYKHGEKTIFFSVVISKKGTIGDLRKMIMNNDEIQKQFESSDDDEPETLESPLNILLVNSNTSASLADTEVVEEVLEHYATVQVIVNN